MLRLGKEIRKVLEDTEKVVVNDILEAIASHRLKAGTKLGEQALADIYKCNRSNVRRALAVLAAQKVVELKPNRGAFVAMPTPRDARNVYQARRAIETTIVRAIARDKPGKGIALLRRHCARELAVRDSFNRGEAIQLSGQFHLILAEIAGNEVLTAFLRELVLRSSLIIGLYAPASGSPCEDDDHSEIVEALASGDGDRAMTLMDHHLRHIESALRFDPPPEERDLRELLSPSGG
jgi:DNA-binding GntR family transcriptional regulator